MEDFYDPEVFFLIDWFFGEYLESGFNGPEMAKIKDWPNFSKWISEAFTYIFMLTNSISK